MVSVAGFGLDIEGAVFWIVSKIQITVFWVIDKGTRLSEITLGAISSFIRYITTTFHYNNIEQMLTLSVISLFGIIILFGIIGGAGIHGEGGEVGVGGLNLKESGFNIGSNTTVKRIGENGTKEVGIAIVTPTTLVSTTTSLDVPVGVNLSCNIHSDCESISEEVNAEITVPYCCPPHTGNCAGFCVLYGCNYGSYTGYSDDCADLCSQGYCLTSSDQIYPVSPLNNTLQNGTSITFDWRGV